VVERVGKKVNDISSLGHSVHNGTVVGVSAWLEAEASAYGPVRCRSRDFADLPQAKRTLDATAILIRTK